MVALTMPAAALLAMFGVSGGEGPSTPVLTTATAHVRMPVRRPMGPENIAPGRVPIDAVTVSGTHVVEAEGARNAPLFAHTANRFAGGGLPNFTIPTFRSIPSNSVRALRFQGTGRRQRGDNANNPFTTKLMLRLTGDAHSMDTEFGFKGGIASALKYALEQ